MCALGFGCRPRLGKGGPVAFLGLGGEARDLAHPLRFRCGTGFFDRLLTARLGLGFEPRQLAIPLRFRRGSRLLDGLLAPRFGLGLEPRELPRPVLLRRGARALELLPLLLGLFLQARTLRRRFGTDPIQLRGELCFRLRLDECDFGGVNLGIDAVVAPPRPLEVDHELVGRFLLIDRFAVAGRRRRRVIRFPGASLVVERDGGDTELVDEGVNVAVAGVRRRFGRQHRRFEVVGRDSRVRGMVLEDRHPAAQPMLRLRIHDERTQLAVLRDRERIIGVDRERGVCGVAAAVPVRPCLGL